MRSLLLWGFSLNQLNPLLISLHNGLVEFPCISSEASERVEIAVLIRETDLLEVCVSVQLCRLDLAIEHFDLVSVEDLDTSFF